MTPKLPYWADQYLQHMQAHRPTTYAALQAAGTLETTALKVQTVASAYYQTQKAYYQSCGDSATQADIQAEGDTMRQYICLAPDDNDRALNDEPP